MTRLNSHNKQLKDARNCRKVVIKTVNDEIRSERQIKIDEIISSLEKMSENEINEFYKYINDFSKSQTSIDKKREKINKYINDLPDDQIFDAQNLLETMVYPKGKHQGEILSPYLQKKAQDFVVSGLYKHESLAQSIQNKTKNLQTKINKLEKINNNSTTKINTLSKRLGKAQQVKNNYISKIRSAIQNAKQLTPNEFQRQSYKLFKKNKKEYRPEFMKLAIDISLVGHTSITAAANCTKSFYKFLTGEDPEKWISPKTLSQWTKEVAEISIKNNKPNEVNSKYFGYGIMADESTRGENKIFILSFAHWNFSNNEPTMTVVEMRDLDWVNAKTVALTAFECCYKNELDPTNCFFWLTDNTSYMSGLAGSAVTEFNKMANINSFRIPCGLHAIHIAMTNFQIAAFGKLDSPSGISFHKHPVSLIRLAFHLHNGYNESDKDSPLNMKFKTIQKLYKVLLNFELTQYQNPTAGRWLYELKTAQQYIE